MGIVAEAALCLRPLACVTLKTAMNPNNTAAAPASATRFQRLPAADSTGGFVASWTAVCVGAVSTRNSGSANCGSGGGGGMDERTGGGNEERVSKEISERSSPLTWRITASRW